MVALAVALVLGLLAAWAALRVLPLLDEARDLRAALERMADRAVEAGTDLDRATLVALREDLASARGHHGRISDVVAGDPLVGIAAFVPPVGHQRDAARALLDATEGLLDAGDRLALVADRYVAIRAAGDGTGSGSTMARLVGLIADSREDVAAARDGIVAARERLADVPDDAAGPIIAARDRAEEILGRYAPLIDELATIDDVLPSILGWDGPRRYLVLAQNPAELRPSGGFIGTIGIVEFDGGRLASQRFQDVHALDGKPDLPYVAPPEALRAHLLGEQSWRLADSNWAPDFPAAAQQALELYTLESGDDDVDGVIALTTYALDELLAVVGPITVADFDVTVAPGETTIVSLAQTRPTEEVPDLERKAFLQSFASELLDDLLGLPVGRLPELLPAFEVIAAERRASVWLVDPAAQALVERAALDGGVRATDGDYLHIVDANVGPVSKLNLVTERSSRLTVRLDEFGNARHELETTWVNHITEAGPTQAILLAYQQRETMGSYFRILVPERSRLESVAGRSDRLTVSGASAIGEAAGRAEFGVYHIVPPGMTVMHIAWTAPYVVGDPDEAGRQRYRLTVQKQAGTIADGLAVRLEPPDGTRIVAAGEGIRVSATGDSAELDTDLRTDLELWVDLAS